MRIYALTLLAGKTRATIQIWTHVNKEHLIYYRSTKPHRPLTRWFVLPQIPKSHPPHQLEVSQNGGTPSRHWFQYVSILNRSNSGFDLKIWPLWVGNPAVTLHLLFLLLKKNHQALRALQSSRGSTVFRRSLRALRAHRRVPQGVAKGEDQGTTGSAWQGLARKTWMSPMAIQHSYGKRMKMDHLYMSIYVDVPIKKGDFS